LFDAKFKLLLLLRRRSPRWKCSTFPVLAVLSPLRMAEVSRYYPNVAYTSTPPWVRSYRVADEQHEHDGGAVFDERRLRSFSCSASVFISYTFPVTCRDHEDQRNGLEQAAVANLETFAK